MCDKQWRSWSPQNKASDLDLHFLPRPVSPNTEGKWLPHLERQVWAYDVWLRFALFTIHPAVLDILKGSWPELFEFKDKQSKVLKSSNI